MNAILNKVPLAEPALFRLRSLVPLAAADIDAIESAALERREVSPRCEIQVEGSSIKERLILLSGWAFHARVLRDGRRQILGYVLPGDLLGNCYHRNAVAATSVIAVTPLALCRAPTPEPDGNLSEAFAVAAATDAHYLYRHITRLGRLSAFERIADWLLEIRERLASSGLTNGHEFALPLTQELIADTLGLTNVHVNRTLQTMRRDGLIELRGGRVLILDELALNRLVDPCPLQISR